MKMRNLLGGFVAVLLSMTLASVALAQNTSSTARGTVSDASGAPIANATVVISHDETGGAKTATTGANGNYFQPGLRIGGPYTLSVSASGYRPSQVNRVFYSQGIQPDLDLVLESASDSIEEIVVLAQAMVVHDLNNGVGSAYNAEDIVNATGGERDVIRTLLRDPLANSSGEGHLSVAGVNARFNGLAIDGSLQQDDFGIGSNTYATERSPINLDAIESVSLVASDYDVTASGFTGGLVNITTKSGTNEWQGSAFYYWQDDDMFGSDFDGGTFDPGPVDETEQGVTLGGPIIKDKLFFFASYDEFEAASSASFASADSSTGALPGFYDTLGTEILNSLGYDPGARPQTASIPTSSERLLVKLDWNINDSHRAAFTYQSTEETGSSVDDESFETAWYDIPLDLEATTFQLFSDWSDKLSTTLRVNNKDFVKGQICRAGTGVGEILINLDEAAVAGTPLDGLLDTGGSVEALAGCDRFRHANAFDDERLQIMAKADYFVGDHVVSFGAEFEDFSLFNLFVSGGARGAFTYQDYDDLVAGTADVTYQNAVSNNSDDAGQTWGYEKTTLFVQDAWQISPTFELGVGFRFESYDQSDHPVFSQALMDEFGVDSTANLDGLDLVLPRISFRWDIGDRTTLSGGIGRFSGGDPKVWISNAFQAPLVFTSGTFTNTDPTVIPQALFDEVANFAGDPVPIDVISEKFDIPSDWKASLRLEHSFDIGSSEDYILTAMWLHTRTEDGFLWSNLAQTTRSTGVAPDGRVIYADLEHVDDDGDGACDDANGDGNCDGVQNLVELGNFSDGESNVYAIALSKRYDSGLDFSLSYAYQDIELVTEGTSSRGISNWRGIIGTDRNNPSPKSSPYQLEHSFKLNVGWEKDFFDTGQSRTRIDAFVRRLSGEPTSFTFDNDSAGNNHLFGRAGQSEEPFDDDLLYIPTGPTDPLVVYGSGMDAQDQQDFFDYVAQHHGKSTGIVKNNTGHASWNTVMDLRIQQEIPGLSFLGNSLGDNNFRIVLNIQNFLNLLNSDWGRWSDGPGFLASDLIEADLVLASDVAANGIDGATALTLDNPRHGCVSQSDCLYRYTKFNSSESFNFTSRSRSVYQLRLGIRFDF